MKKLIIILLLLPLRADAAQIGGGHLGGVVTYTGLPQISAQTVTASTALYVEKDLFVSETGTIDTPEIFNSRGDLKIMPDVQGDVTLFEDTDIEATTAGKRFKIWRKAEEGDHSMDFFIEADEQAVLGYTGNVWLFINATDLKVMSNAEGGVSFFEFAHTGENPSFKQAGYLTNGNDEVEIMWTVKDTDDYFWLERENTNILGLKIDMPVDLIDNAFTTTGNVDAPNLPYAPDAVVYVHRGTTDILSATNLATAYATASALTPGGSALSATNRACVYIPSGGYDIVSTTLVLDTQYVDLIAEKPERGGLPQATDLDEGNSTSLTQFRPSPTVVYSSENTITVIEQAAQDVRLTGFSIAQLSASPASAFKCTVDDNAGSYYDKMYFWSRGATGDENGVKFAKHIRGVWHDCIANGYAWRCGTDGEFSAEMYDCYAGVYSFGGDVGAGAVGCLMVRCKAIGQYPGGDPGQSGFASFLSCDAVGIPIDADSIFVECESGDHSFGLGVKVEGTFIRCRGGNYCFGSELAEYGGDFAGYAEDCVSGKGSFGGRKVGTGNYGKCTGTLVRCTIEGSELGMRLEGATIRNSRLTTTTNNEDGVVLLDGNSEITDTTILVNEGGTGIPINDDGNARNVIATGCEVNNFAVDSDGLGANVTNVVTPYLDIFGNVNVADLTATGDVTASTVSASTVNVHGIILDGSDDSITTVGTGTFNEIKATGSGLIWSDGTTGTLPTTGAGVRMMWIPASKAFRAGEVTGTDWDDIGGWSVAFGKDNEASGNYSFSTGGFNTSSGDAYSFTAGSFNTSSGWGGIAMGNACQALGTYSVAMPRQVISNANYAISFGKTFTNSTADSFAVGFTAIDLLITSNLANFQDCIIQTGNKIQFTQTDGNEFIDSLNDGYMDYGATTGHRFNNAVTVNGLLQMGDDDLIAVDVNSGLTASTTQEQGQGALTAQVNEISTVANDGDTVTLPSAVTGIEIEIINNGAKTLQIFPASGDDMGLGVNVAEELEANERVKFVAYDTTNWAKESSTEIIHAEMFDYDNTDAYVINAASEAHMYHTNGMQAGDLADFTFDAGGAGTSFAIASIADGTPSGQQAEITTTLNHGLAVGDIVSLTAMSAGTNTGTFIVRTPVADKTFEITSGDSTDATGTMDQAATLEADAVAAGQFLMNWSASAASAGANNVFDFAIHVGATHINSTNIRRKFGGAGDVGAMSGVSIITIGSGDKVSFMITNTSGSGNITIRDFTLVLVRL